MAQSLNVRNQAPYGSQQVNMMATTQQNAPLSSREKRGNQIKAPAHHRNLTNDDRVMEVEAFDHSNQMKQERDGQNNPKNHQNIMDSFELATSKPLNSSRVMLNRRFQNQNQ